LVKLESGSWHLLYVDRRLPDLDAEELVQIIKRRFPGIEVVVVDSDGGQVVPMARKAHWPRELRAVESRTPEATGELEDHGPDEIVPLPGMIGRAESMRRLYELTRLVAPRLTTVLITGPTGTGKELVARAVHQLSPRAGRPFAVVNCAAI